MKTEFDCNKIFAIVVTYYESYGPMNCSYFKKHLFVRVLPNEVNSSEEFTLLEETANEWLTNNNYSSWYRTDSDVVDWSGENNCDDENSIYFASPTNEDFIEVCYGTLADLTFPEDINILEEAARQWGEL